MTQSTVQQERRVLNEAIEHTYIEVAARSANIRTHFQTGRGVISDLYEAFYFNMEILYELTSDLEEMKDSATEIKVADDWLNLPRPRTSEYEERCISGRDTFIQYKRALNRCGLFSLPSKGK